MIDGLHCSSDLFLNFPLEEQRKHTSAISHIVFESYLKMPTLSIFGFLLGVYLLSCTLLYNEKYNH